MTLNLKPSRPSWPSLTNLVSTLIIFRCVPAWSAWPPPSPAPPLPFQVRASLVRMASRVGGEDGLAAVVGRHTPPRMVEQMKLVLEGKGANLAGSGAWRATRGGGGA